MSTAEDPRERQPAVAVETVRDPDRGAVMFFDPDAMGERWIEATDSVLVDGRWP